MTQGLFIVCGCTWRISKGYGTQVEKSWKFQVVGGGGVTLFFVKDEIYFFNLDTWLDSCNLCQYFSPNTCNPNFTTSWIALSDEKKKKKNHRKKSKKRKIRECRKKRRLTFISILISSPARKKWLEQTYFLCKTFSTEQLSAILRYKPFQTMPVFVL